VPYLRLWLRAALGAVVLLLLAANGVKYGFLSWEWLETRNDALDAAYSAVSIVAILVGGVLAYYRFFRGRTLATRAELSVDIEILEAPENRLMHVITVRVKNVGTVTIWDPRPIIDGREHRTGGIDTQFRIDRWYEPLTDANEKTHLGVLDSGESGDFFAQRIVDSEPWAVTYVATVRCASGDSWTKLKTVANRLPRDNAAQAQPAT
jgi:hypothetical protein